MADPRDNVPVATLDTVIVTATKTTTSQIVPNPLHGFASYTYNISLWWLDTIDYNRLMTSADTVEAMAWRPSATSYCVAQDSGLYPNNRVPGTPGLNYNIQDVKFETTISQNKQSRSSNLLEGSMTIVEPYGVTWFETLLAASFDGQKYNNWTRQPFMLQIDFKGYDDNGNPMPDSEITKYRKRFPISILTAKMNLTNKGAEYKLTFCPMGATAHYPDYANTPKVFSITAGTVGEFFKQLSVRYAYYFFGLVQLQKAAYAENIDFDIHPSIANSTIVDDKELPFARSNSKSGDISFNKSTWTIPAGTPILDLITKIMAHSKYLIDQTKSSGNVKSDFDIFKSFKTTVKTLFIGIDSDGEYPGVIDPITNRPPKSMTYTIAPYSVYNGSHPEMPSFSDSRPYTIKKYDYYYTGKNIDVLNFKLDFDTTYYTAVQAYTSAIAATESSRSTKIEEEQVNPTTKPKNQPLYNPVWFAWSVPSITPLMYRPIVKDKETSSGFNLSSRPSAQIAADVMKSIYTDINGDMLSLDIDIVGDPTLLKQDDWLYIAKPSDQVEYYKLTQIEYANKYGHVKTDEGQLIVNITVNSPVDVDTEWVNQGLMTPLPTYQKSVFSGQYQILTIISKFASGKFEQSLKLARYFNQDIISALKPAPGGDAVSTGQTNQSNTAAPNNSGNAKRQ